MRAGIVAVTLAGFVLVGCAATGKHLLDESKAALDAAPLCCKTLATAQALPLPTEPKPVDVVIDKTSQAFDFGGNKAFFVLYKLPEFEKPYAVVVTSVAVGALADVSLLVPRMATYGADFKVLRYFDEKTLRNRGNNLERTVFVNPPDRPERYLAIYGSDLSASIERAYSTVTVTPIMVGPVMFNLYGGQDGKSTLRSAPAGKLQLEVQGLATVDR